MSPVEESAPDQDTAPRLTTFTGVGGIRLTADAYGPQTGPAVVFLHGGGQNRHSWRRAGAALAADGLRVLVLDARGHGDSEWSAEGDYSLDSLAGDVREVIHALGVPVILVGASMGGLTGLLVAEAEGKDSVVGLALVDVVPRIEEAGGQRIQNFMRGNPDGFASLEEAADAVAAYLPHRPRPRSPEGLRRNLRQREDGRWYWHWDPAMMGSNTPNPASNAERLEAAAAALKVPVLLVRGLLSDVVSEQGVHEFRERVPGTQLIELPGAAHTAAGDDNDLFAEAVRGFVLDLTASGGVRSR